MSTIHTPLLVSLSKVSSLRFTTRPEGCLLAHVGRVDATDSPTTTRVIALAVSMACNSVSTQHVPRGEEPVPRITRAAGSKHLRCRRTRVTVASGHKDHKIKGPWRGRAPGSEIEELPGIDLPSTLSCNSHALHHFGPG